MPRLKNIYDLKNRPVGYMTLGKLLAALTVFVVCVTAFAFIAREVTAGETLATDQSILLKLNHLATPQLDVLVALITAFGDVIAVAAITLGLVALFIYRQKWQAAAQVAFSIAGAGALNFILKLLFERHRPDLWEQLVHESSYSFPSGHATLTGALGFTVIILAWHTRFRWPVIILAACYIGIIGLTRLYLGVHYPTDILAGWCVSFAWVITVAMILGAVRWRLLK